MGLSSFCEVAGIFLDGRERTLKKGLITQDENKSGDERGKRKTESCFQHEEGPWSHEMDEELNTKTGLC